MAPTRARKSRKRYWSPRTDRKHFLPGGEMPAVFGTFDRTQLIAVLATYGAMPTRALAEAFGVRQPSMVRRLQSAQSHGLIERIPSTGRKIVSRISRAHPARKEILALAKALGRLFSVPHPSEQPTQPQEQAQRTDPPNEFRWIVRPGLMRTLMLG